MCQCGTRSSKNALEAAGHVPSERRLVAQCVSARERLACTESHHPPSFTRPCPPRPLHGYPPAARPSVSLPASGQPRPALPSDVAQLDLQQADIAVSTPIALSPHHGTTLTNLSPASVSEASLMSACLPTWQSR